MNFYSFDEIRERGSCVRFVEECLGAEVKHGRCAAVWRGGDGPNIALTEKEWHDHVAKVGGGILELCAKAKFQDDIQQAQNFLGEWLHLEPKMRMRTSPSAKQSRYDELIADGYREAKRYPYRDLDGTVRHFVVRLEHPEKPKEFVQGTPSGWGTKGVSLILYRLKDWKDKPGVFIVEGEKDADTLNDIGIPATTNCQGAGKWDPEYNAEFIGKHVVIIRDNDEPGEKHAIRVAGQLLGKAASIKVLCPSSLPKGDVSDWIQKEGGTPERLKELVKAAPYYSEALVADIEDRIFQIDKPPKKEEPRLTLTGIKVCTVGNLAVIGGLAGTGKSQIGVAGPLAAVMAGNREGVDLLGWQSLNPKGHAVIHIDSEQSPGDWHTLLTSATRRAGLKVPPSWLVSYHLTGFNPDIIRGYLPAILDSAKRRFGGIHFVIVDGFADLILDVNDMESSVNLVTDLHASAMDYETAIIGVVHQNQGSDNTRTRGHLGAQLERKAETVLCMRRDDDATLIYTTKSRGSPISRDKGPRYRWDIEAGRFVMIGTIVEQKRTEREAKRIQDALEILGGEPSMSFSRCVERIMEIDACKEKTAQQKLARLKKAGVMALEPATKLYYIPYEYRPENPGL